MARTKTKQPHSSNTPKAALVRQLLAAAQDVLWLTDLDTGRVLYVSPSFERVFGLPRARVLESRQVLLEVTHPEDRAELARVFRSRGSREVEEPFTYRIVRPEGSLAWIEIRLSHVVASGRRKVNWRVGVARDVTARVEAERALEHRVAELQALLASAPAIIGRLDLEGRLTEVNRLPARQYRREDIVGRHWREIFHPALLEPMQAAIDEALQQRRPTSVTGEGWGEGFAIRTWRFDVGPILLSERPVGIVIVATDVTERTRAREQVTSLAERLATSQEEERRRIAAFAHDELGAKAALLSLDLAAAQQFSDESSPVRKPLQRAQGEVESLGRAIRELAGRLRPPALDQLGLSEAIRELAGEFQARTGITTRVRGGEEFRPDHVPQEVSLACYRAVQESLTNVARHAAASQVWIELERRDGVLEARVADNGRGFDPALIDSAGHLGIVGMRERSAALGGHVSLDTAPERGVVVTLRLPLTPGSDAAS